MEPILCNPCLRVAASALLTIASIFSLRAVGLYYHLPTQRGFRQGSWGDRESLRWRPSEIGVHSLAQEERFRGISKRT